jgi:hypothetical protein
MLFAYPYVPIAGSVRIGIAIFSYCGGLNFGVTGDYDSVHDIEVLTRGIESGIAELLVVARRASPVIRMTHTVARRPIRAIRAREHVRSAAGAPSGP